MIGTLSDSRDVTIVGAGFAGLLMAFTLERKGYRVTLLEAQPRAGGLITTFRTPYGIAESAAHSLLATPNVFRFFQAAGIPWNDLRKDSHARFILRGGRPCKVPLSFTEVLGLLRRVAFAKAPPAAGGEIDERLDLWAKRHLGQPALDYLLAPFVRGVYGAHPEELGVATAFPTIVVPPGRTLLGTMLSRKKKGPRSRMVAPSGGMADVVEKLSAYLEQKLGASFRKDAPVTELPENGNVVIATAAYDAARLLERADPELGAALAAVKYTPIVSVTAFVRNVDFERPVRGVGVLVPPRENRIGMGILFNSSSFAGRSTDEAQWSSFTVMMGGPVKPDLLDASDDEIRAIVLNEMRAMLRLKNAPVHCVINRWKRALPQYSPELNQTWALARRGWCARPGRILFGNYTRDISLRGMVERVAEV